jgi:Flp pilus assembly protein TadG
MRRGPLTHAWRRFGRDRRGVAAIEFALVVPIVIVVYAVGFEIAEAATVYRKLTDTTVQLANVTAQYTTMTTTDTSNVMSASAQIMSPYSTGSLTIVMSLLTTNAAGTSTTVTWSQAYQTTALAKGTAMTPPTGFQTANGSYILVQTSYSYSPIVGSAFMQPIQMSNQIFMMPRQSTTIACSTC